MKSVSICCVLALLAGCASNPPPTPVCRGEFRPVNQAAKRAALPATAVERLALCPSVVNGGHHG